MTHTCGTCHNWRYDVNDKQERDMSESDRRPCALTKTVIDRATFMHSTIPSCEKYKMITVRSIKESTRVKIDGLYGALGKKAKNV
jgi:hypothetical protein